MPVVVGAILLTLIGAVAALRLSPNAGVDTLVDKGSTTYQQTQDFHRTFGDDPVEVLVKGDLGKLMLTSDLEHLLALEGCLAGNAPNGQVIQNKPAPAGCAELATLKPAHVVYGPA